MGGGWGRWPEVVVVEAALVKALVGMVVVEGGGGRWRRRGGVWVRGAEIR